MNIILEYIKIQHYVPFGVFVFNFILINISTKINYIYNICIHTLPNTKINLLKVFLI